MDEPTKEEAEAMRQLVVSDVQVTSQEIFDKLKTQDGCSELLVNLIQNDE